MFCIGKVHKCSTWKFHLLFSQVIRTIQAKGIQGLNEADKKKYVPPIGGGFAAASMPLMDQLALADVISNSSNPYGTGPYQYSQARIVADHVMTKVWLGPTGVVYLFSLLYHLSHLIALSIVNTTDIMWILSTVWEFINTDRLSIILQLNGTFCWEFVRYDFPMVALHTN